MTDQLQPAKPPIPRLYGVKLYTSKGRVYAYFRPTHTRLRAEPYSEAFVEEWKIANDNYQNSQHTRHPKK